LETATEERPHAREAQKRLAAEMTTLVHGEEATRSVELASQALFGRAELTDLDESTLAAALHEASVADIEVGAPNTIVDLLVATGLSESKGAARRAVKEGGAAVNNVKIADENWTPSSDDLLHGQWLVVRRGKRNFAGARVAR
jgi:tyrosyl-tRNA synthetase